MFVAKLRLLDAGLLVEMLELEAVVGQKEFVFDEESGESSSTKLDEAGIIAKISTDHAYFYHILELYRR